MLSYGEVRLWPLERPDLVQNYQWANDPELIELAGMTPKPKTGPELERWYESILGAPDLQIFSIKLADHTYVGNIELRTIDQRSGKAEVGVIVGSRDHWGRGLGRQAVEAVSAYAFRELRLHRLYARVLSLNPRALKVFERCGFRPEGIEREAHFSGGRYLDIHILGLLASEWGAEGL